MKSLAIRLVDRDQQPEALRLLAELNPELDSDTLLQRLETIRREHSHYQLHGAYDGDELVAVCGSWVATKLWCGRYLEVDNIVTASGRRCEGAGTRLMQAMEQLAREQDCGILVLDSYASNTASHRLYHRLGYEIKGFHFVKVLTAGFNPPEHA